MIYDYLTKKEKCRKNYNFMSKESQKFNNNISLFHNLFIFVVFGVISMTLYFDITDLLKNFETSVNHLISNGNSSFFNNYLSSLNFDYIFIKDNILSLSYSVFSFNNIASEVSLFSPFGDSLSFKNDLANSYLFYYVIFIIPILFAFQIFYSLKKIEYVGIKLTILSLLSFIFVLPFLLIINHDYMNSIFLTLNIYSKLFYTYAIIAFLSFFFLCVSIYKNLKHGRFNEDEYKKRKTENETLNKNFLKIEDKIINSEDDMNLVLELYKDSNKQDKNHHLLADLISDFNYSKKKELEVQNKINDTKNLMNEYFKSNNTIKEQNLMQND